MNKSQKVALCVVLLIVLLIAWGLFPLFFKWLMIGIGSKETALKDFGTFGDIYGSLNTLFTSATLIIVMYSAYLQRQANKDARDAMERQLQQAREDTEEQLKQAREATEQQILNAQQLAHIQLEHARQYSMDQLALARATHEAQIKESKDAIFTNKFYSHLNYKNAKLNSIFLTKKDKDLSGNIIEKQVPMIVAIDEIVMGWLETVKENQVIYNNLSNMELLNKLYNLVQTKLKYETISSLISYFHIYSDFFDLIRDSKISEEDKVFYKSVISNSMTQHEQVLLFIISPMFNAIDLTDSEIFSLLGYMTILEDYAIEYHKVCHFKYDDWKQCFV
ncbi:hypothetical protein [uncultured Acinetobacter sp.]|uniref:hypothetical protein n=1 Tax=uncultured Acinetobacter sp. TaxID=165433 RepID=UPI00258ADE9C|nr:hypothetical protein [uncultured Acinetobacter sp.]